MVVVNQWLNVTTNTKEDRHCVRLRDTRNASNIHAHVQTCTCTHTHTTYTFTCNVYIYAHTVLC